MNIFDIISGGFINSLEGFLKTLREVLTGDMSPDKKAELLKKAQEIEEEYFRVKESIIKEQANVIREEIRSDSWLTRNWRPLTMLIFVFIIFNDYVIVPYLKAFGFKAVYLDIPKEGWELIKFGLGGYVAGRSIEKVVSTTFDNIRLKRGRS